MIAVLGNAGLALAAAMAVTTIIACAAAGTSRKAGWLTAARWTLVLSACAFLIAATALGTALVAGDLRFTYVSSHTELALTPAYRLAAFWSGQEGSLLLWALMISGFAAAAGMIRKRVAAAGEGVTLSVLAALDLFFGTLLLFAANPFALETEVGIDGMGLNPQLQHWAMIAHPPMLFMGYAGFAVPFAIMCGALAAGRRDNLWVN